MKEKNKENKNSKNKQFKKGFTLIEMLVVVLIIGILAGIALPQYTLAVEKARSAEVLMNLATMKRDIGLYITTNGLPSSGFVYYKDFATVELSGGEWEGNSYKTKKFEYIGSVGRNYVYVEIDEENSNYILNCTPDPEEGFNDDTQMSDGWYCSCITNTTDIGKKICKAIYEPLGFKYIDDGW